MQYKHNIFLALIDRLRQFEFDCLNIYNKYLYILLDLRPSLFRIIMMKALISYYNRVC